MGWPLAGPGFISSCVTVQSRHLQIRPRSKSSKRMFQIFDTRTISQTHFLEGNSINIAGIPIFVLMNTSSSGSKGTFHLRFSGIRPLRGYPPPLLTENQCEKKKVFFLSGKGGYPPAP